MHLRGQNKKKNKKKTSGREERTSSKQHESNQLHFRSYTISRRNTASGDPLGHGGVQKSPAEGRASVVARPRRLVPDIHSVPRLQGHHGVTAALHVLAAVRVAGPGQAVVLVAHAEGSQEVRGCLAEAGHHDVHVESVDARDRRREQAGGFVVAVADVVLDFVEEEGASHIRFRGAHALHVKADGPGGTPWKPQGNFAVKTFVLLLTKSLMKE